MFGLRALSHLKHARGLPASRLAATGARALATARVPVPAPGSEAKLFTPGPLTTSRAVKEAMLVDLGSRDASMVEIIRSVRSRLLSMAGGSQEAGYECVLVPGSGTTCVESVISSSVGDGRLLVVVNGAYGQRICTMAEYHNIKTTALTLSETEPVTVDQVLDAVRDSEGAITHVAVIHHETTAGLVNPVHDIGRALSAAFPDVTYIVDSMSAFGAYPVDVLDGNMHYMVSSANKNIEGVPGFAFAVFHRDTLLREGLNARSLSLDLLEQWKGLENNGQFRFTPPCHALLAFDQALAEHEAEGGVAGRAARYQRNFEVLKEGMADMGFHLYVPEAAQGFIISTFLFPEDPAFHFPTFYAELAKRGLVIYPGKLTEAECFRIGSIGRLDEANMRELLQGVREVLGEMGVALPVTQAS